MFDRTKHRTILYGVVGLVALSGCTSTPRDSYVSGVAVEVDVEEQGDVDVAIFYESLEPWGRWVSVEEYGWVWIPHGVGIGWRPYTDGHWVWTDCGWYWVSDWQWGWAPFHYGRWYFHDDWGWTWIPGGVWAPAWVAWRHGDRHIGWAPLPPHAQWSRLEGDGWRRNGDQRLIPAHAWCFVEARQFRESKIQERLAPLTRGDDLLRETTDVTKYESEAGRVVNRSMPLDERGADPTHRIAPLRVTDAKSVEEARPRGDELPAYRPISRPAVKSPPKSKDAEPKRAPTAVPKRREPPIPAAKPRTADAELQKLQENERRQLSQRHEVERRRLDEAQKVERLSVPKDTTAEQVERRQAADRAAVQKQLERESKLLEKEHQIERSGTAPRTASDQRRFKFEPREAPAAVPQPSPRPAPKGAQPPTQRPNPATPPRSRETPSKEKPTSKPRRP